VIIPLAIDLLATLKSLFTFGVPFLLLLGVLVLVHEWGHFVVARLTKMPVEEFWIGFPPGKTWQRGDLKIGLGTIPLGGFVKITGMQLEEWDHPEGFNSKSLGARIAVLLAGCAMNLALGYVVLLLLYSAVNGSSNYVRALILDRPAARSGLKPGDQVVAINGKPMSSSEDIIKAITSSEGKRQTLVVRRAGQRRSIPIQPERMPLPAGGNPDNPEQMRYGIGTIFGPNWVPTGFNLKVGFQRANATTATLLGMLVRLPIELVRRPAATLQMVGGPVSIVSQAGQSAQEGPYSFLFLMAQLSYSLAIFNLLPIPALDGGRILLICYSDIQKALIGRPFDPRKEVFLNAAGLAFLLLFILVISAKDLGQIVGGG